MLDIIEMREYVESYPKEHKDTIACQVIDGNIVKLEIIPLQKYQYILTVNAKDEVLTIQNNDLERMVRYFNLLITKGIDDTLFKIQ